MLNSCNGHQQAVGTWVQMWAACVELLEGWHTFITSYSSSLPMLTEPWPNKPPRNIKLLSQHAAVRSRMCRPRRGQPITLKKNFEGNSIAGLRERRKTQCCVMQQNSQWRAGPATPAPTGLLFFYFDLPLNPLCEIATVTAVVRFRN